MVALQCHGKCHLKKELQKSAQEESGKNSKIVIQLETEDMPAKSSSLTPREFFISNLYFHDTIENIKYFSSDLVLPPPRI